MGDYLHELYDLIVGFEPMPPSALVMFEEILGEPFHRASNERVYQERGFIDRVSKRGIPFYRILARSPTLMGTVRAFNSRVEELLMTYRRRHMFFELTPKGDLGGINPGYESNYECDGDIMDEFVVGLRLDDEVDSRRVTISFKTIDYASNIWVFAFGSNVDKALKSFVRGARREYNNFPVGYLHQTGKDIHVFTDRSV